MAPVVCQRWRDRRASYRPAGEIFDPRSAHVEAIDEATAKAFAIRHHYSGSYPAARFRAGLFVKRPFALELLAGVAVFSVPMNQLTVPHYFTGLEPNAGVELGRLVLLDEIPANAESWFVARAFRLLREQLPGVSGVVSYSDPVERRAAGGEVVKPGHVGTVYQALNAAYRGRASARTILLSRCGQVITRRTISKLRNDERGAGYAYDLLRKLGAPVRQPLEAGPAYVARVMHEGQFRTERHPGNHAYTWWLGERRARPRWSQLAYPKAIAS